MTATNNTKYTRPMGTTSHRVFCKYFFNWEQNTNGDGVVALFRFITGGGGGQ